VGVFVVMAINSATAVRMCNHVIPNEAAVCLCGPSSQYAAEVRDPYDQSFDFVSIGCCGAEREGKPCTTHKKPGRNLTNRDTLTVQMVKISGHKACH
jgi:hypothetical protein